MNPREKQLRTVDAHAEDNPDGVDKAVHRLRINPLIERFPLKQTVNPGMMGIHIAETVGAVVKRAVGKIDHAENQDDGEHDIFRQPPLQLPQKRLSSPVSPRAKLLPKIRRKETYPVGSR